MAGPEHNYPVGFMASGSGTTIESFGHSIVANNLPMEIRAVVCDRPGAGVLGVVEGLNETYGWDIKPVLVDKETYSGGAGERAWDLTDEQSDEIASVFVEEGVTVVAMLGFLSRVRGSLYDQFGALPDHNDLEQAALINSHPGYLWQTKGLYGHGVHKKVAADGLDTTAQTLHVASDQFDEGGIIEEHEVAVLPAYTWEDIERAVQSAEKMFVPQDTLAFISAREAYLQAKVAAANGQLALQGVIS